MKMGGKGDNRGWDGWMASLTQSTLVWLDSGSWWWTGRPGVLQFMGVAKSQIWLSDWTDWPTYLPNWNLWVLWWWYRLIQLSRDSENLLSCLKSPTLVRSTQSQNQGSVGKTPSKHRNNLNSKNGESSFWEDKTITSKATLLCSFLFCSLSF